MVVLVEDAPTSAPWPASIVTEEAEGFVPSATRRDVIEGSPNQVLTARNTANHPVLVSRTSTASRPSAHLTDEPEEVDGRVVREAPPPSERLDGILYAAHAPRARSGTGTKVRSLRTDGGYFRLRRTSRESSISTRVTACMVPDVRDQTHQVIPAAFS